jgi:hypothetical protein
MRRISCELRFSTSYLPFGLVRYFGAHHLSPLIGKEAWAVRCRPFLALPILMAIFGYFIMKKLVFNLADEVSTGDFSLSASEMKKKEFRFLEIMNVLPNMTNPPRNITLRTPIRR